jgi:hypothetical protein
MHHPATALLLAFSCAAGTGFRPRCGLPTASVDNGSSHRGPRCIARLQRRWPRLTVVHTPVHASWLNQIEIYFSVVQRKVYPERFCLTEPAQRSLVRFESHYEQVAQPFEWKFTRRDLEKLIAKLHDGDTRLAAA